MPLFSGARIRKRWRYVGLYGPEVMLCAARAEVGPLVHCFWAVWDRQGERSYEHTRFRPGGDEVVLDGTRLAISHSEIKAELRLGEAEPIEVICPSGDSWSWTRKRAGVPITGTVEINGRRVDVDAMGVEDVSAGYHQRHTSWRWSAGVGTSLDGRPVAWNLTTGINDPPVNSERAVWLGGCPSEVGPVTFDGPDSISFGTGDHLDFESGSERSRDDNFLLVRSRYRHRFGTFTGAVPGAELASGLGVMEEHEALW